MLQRMDAAGRWPSAGLLAQCAAGPPERPPRTPGARPVLLLLLLGLLMLVTPGSSAVITGACEMDTQCGGGMCCAVSLWIRSLRMCTPMGQEGDDCHPMSHYIPFQGKRLHHTCPCLPNLTCVTTEEGKSRCFSSYKYQDDYL